MNMNGRVRVSVAYPIMITVLRIYPPLNEESGPSEMSDTETPPGDAVVESTLIDASTLLKAVTETQISSPNPAAG